MIPNTDFYLSIVIPVYKAVDCLEELYRQLISSLKEKVSKFEVILVEDSGNDGSWEKILEICELDSRFIGVKLSRNFGQHAAILAGLKEVKGDYIIVMDCDLQDSPAEIPKLVFSLLKNSNSVDMVLASRSDRQDGFFKKHSSKLFYGILSYLSGFQIDNTIANFGIYKRKVIESVKLLQESSQFFPIFIQWIGFRKMTLEVQHGSRFSGLSAYNFKKSLNLALTIAVAFSDKPLRIMVKFGLVITVVAIIFLTKVLITAFFKKVPVVGWSSLFVSIWFLGGVIITQIGILGLYVGRTYEEGKRRPLFLIEERKGNGR